MRRMNSKSVDLIYLDPPFNSKANYAAPIGSKAAGAEFRDTWYLDDIDKEWIQSIAKKHPKLYRVLLASMNDSDKAYLAYMSPRMIELQRILKPTGNIYLHCDPTMSHYLKMAMDAIFGRENFRNEIIWQRDLQIRGAKRASKQFPRVNDSLLFYSNGSEWSYNQPFKELTDKQKSAYRYKEDGTDRRYRTSDLGFYSEASIKRLEEEGLIHVSSSGIKSKKYYLDEAKSVVGNVWTDIHGFNIRSQSKEKTGYPTQKPLALLRRITKASSKEEDIVFDPFCGCATTLVAADELQRNWVGIDISPKAVELVVDRIKEAQRMFKDIIPRQDIPQRTDMVKLPSPRSQFDHLYGKQRGYCNGCKEHKNPDICEVDHIIAKSKGGTDHVDNLQILCRPCNMKKGNRSMEYLTLANKRLKEILEIM